MSFIDLRPHAPHPFFRVDGDCVVVADRSIVDVAQQAQRTPFYVYASCYMTERVKLLRELASSRVKLHYSMKANPMPAVVGHMTRLVDGIDVASGGELRTALAAGADPLHVSFTGPGKRKEELSEAVAAKVLLIVESATELQRLGQIAEAAKIRARVAIRINPPFELVGSGMRMSGGSKQFGIDSESVPAVLTQLAQLPLEFVGFHVFSGSQNLNASAIADAHQRAVNLVLELARFAPSPVRVVSVGGSLGVPYFPGELPVDLPTVVSSLNQLAHVCERRLGAELAVELGRYLVGESGLYVCAVVDRKVSRGRVFLVTDGGLHHHLAASGNFGQVLRKNYPVLIGNRVRGSERECVTIVGPLCTPLDLIADRVEVARADTNDLVVVFQSGAYGMTASPIGFLSHPPPLELFI